MSDGFDDRSVPRAHPCRRDDPADRAGAAEEPAARSAVNIAHVLLRAGARALVAAEGGPLVNELTTAGGEWIPMVERQRQSVAAAAQRARARAADRAERVDIVHA